MASSTVLYWLFGLAAVLGLAIACERVRPRRRPAHSSAAGPGRGTFHAASTDAGSGPRPRIRTSVPLRPRRRPIPPHPERPRPDLLERLPPIPLTESDDDLEVLLRRELNDPDDDIASSSTSPTSSTPPSTPPSTTTEGGRRVNATTAYYRTKDGAADYKFTFKEYAPGHWRAYIDEQPPYGGRPTGMHETHRLTDGGRFYVCWAGTLPTESAARAVAALWADNTQRYIATGRRF